MPRIREDFDGGIWAQGRNEHGHATLEPVWLVAGDEVPAGVTVSAEHLEQEAANSTPSSPPDGGGDGPGKDPSPPPPGPPPFDPDEFTVDEVNDQLEKLDDDAVRAVIEAEQGGRARHGIVAGPAARRLPH